MGRTAAPFLLLLPLLGGCGTTAPTRPPGVSPTPVTVTKSNPGGDAADPELAALERLAAEPWGSRRDHWNTLKVPLLDWKNWRRVTFWGHPLRAAYRYGDEHYAITTVWYSAVEGPNDPDACLARFLEYAVPIARSFHVKLGEPLLTRGKQRIRGES